jgi:hypothetical protein
MVNNPFSNVNLIHQLRNIYNEAYAFFQVEQAFIDDEQLLKKVMFICRNIKNKAPIRFLLSCLVAKLDNPTVDVRKPYTSIPGDDHFSGRRYDEGFVQQLIKEFNLPCNHTTAYLTPAFRNGNEVMRPGLKLEGRPPEIYSYTLEVLDAVFHEEIAVELLMGEILRQLIIVRDQQSRRINELLEALTTTLGGQPLSSEEVITLIEQHLNCPNASRLPTLTVAAAYNTVSGLLGEQIRTLKAHNAADRQTGALGDVEIVLTSEDSVVTCYEMKHKRVTIFDIDATLPKLAEHGVHLNNYIFITTEPVDDQVMVYAKSLYSRTGVEFGILNCIAFLRHFLHLFHRHRVQFLENYQSLVLSEPDSSVSQPLKVLLDIEL